MSDQAPHLRAVDASADAAVAGEQPVPWTGITPPSRRGGSSRFLTDVLIELGYCERERVEAAIADARSKGSMPERLLLE